MIERKTSSQGWTMDGRVMGQKYLSLSDFESRQLSVVYLQKVLHQTGGTIELHR